jgi:uncharacterized protein (TIGR03437 family)
MVVDPSGNVFPAPSCLVNGASLAYAPATAGTIATLFGSNLGSSDGLQHQLDADGRVPIELDGTTITVGGIPAPLLYVQERQINFVVPQRVNGATTDVCVIRAGLQSCIFAFVVNLSKTLSSCKVADLNFGVVLTRWSQSR